MIHRGPKEEKNTALLGDISEAHPEILITKKSGKKHSGTVVLDNEL